MTNKHKDISGKEFTALTVLKYLRQENNSTFIYLCKCKVCNKEVEKASRNLANAKSCGCRMGRFKHGLRQTPLYKLWKSIKDRCYREKNKDYENYGGRGIRMPDCWVNNPEAFVSYIKENLGEKPSKKYSLDRVDNNKGYEPGNLRWATQETQTGNTRSSSIIEFNDEKKCIAEWERVLGFNPGTLKRRLLKKWPIEKAFNEPVRKNLRWHNE